MRTDNDGRAYVVTDSDNPLDVNVVAGEILEVEIKNDVGNPVLATLVDTLPAGSNLIGKTGYQLKRISISFQRPGDTAQYAIGDAISNSTSAPAVFELNLASVGAVAGQSVELRKLAIVSSIKQATLPLINAFLSSTTFSATNDNSALSIDDTTMELGGSWFACDVQNYTALNQRCAYIGPPQPMILAAADTKLYGALQAANAYTPGSEEKFTIIAWVALL